jgi:hypothetical protein
VAWIDGQYLFNAIGGAQTFALGLTASAVSTDITPRFTQYELEARSGVLSAMQLAGYPLPSDTLSADASAAVTNAFLQRMVAACVLRDAYGLLPGIELSQITAGAINQGLSMLDSIAAVDTEKRKPIPGLQPNAADAIDGSQFNTDPAYVAPRTTPVFTVLRRSSF